MRGVNPISSLLTLLPMAVLSQSTAGQIVANRTAPNVVDQFNKLKHHGEALAFHRGVGGDPDQTYHYQGIARSSHLGTPYLFVTRSDPNCGELLVVEMGSRGMDGERMRSNLLKKGVATASTVPPSQDIGSLTSPLMEALSLGTSTPGEYSLSTMSWLCHSKSPASRGVRKACSCWLT